jgi:predicted phosphodiesterase
VTSLSDDLNTPPSKVTLGKIAELLNRNNIDVDEVGSIKRVSLYQSMIKNDVGQAEVHDLMGIQFNPKWADGPEWPVVQPGPAIKLPARKATAKDTDGYKTAVILPDMQIGYYRGPNGLEPTHDEEALAIALAITRKLNPDRVVMVGDNLDFPEFGKYRLSSAYALTTQASIDRATTLCAEVRAAAPNAEIDWISGNHEERLSNFLLDNAKASFGIRKGNTPDSWPVLSVPYLCRFDDYGVNYVAGYPAGQVWINQRLKVIHGNKVRSNGSTAHAYLNDSKVSVIYGHIHRREWCEKTRQDWDGAKTVMAASPGTLARCDGAVPSTKGGIDLDGRPLSIVEDWQQGLGVVTYEEGEGQFWYEQVPIHNTSAFFRGRVYQP